MDVFISWSGPRSKRVAEIFTDWLPQVIQAVNPWMSKDIEKGVRWNPEISEKLALCKVGVICLTPENLHADWILFEAGALSKIMDSKVCTFLLELSPTDIEEPLAQFQHTVLSHDDVKSLIKTINMQLMVCNEHSLSEKTLNSVFEKNWPDFESAITSIPPIPKSKTKKQERSDRELMEEILELTRRLLSESRRNDDAEYLRRKELGKMYELQKKSEMDRLPLWEREKDRALLVLRREYQDLVNVKGVPAEKALSMVKEKLSSVGYPISQSELDRILNYA